MASAEVSRRVEDLVGFPPLCGMGDRQWRELGDLPKGDIHGGSPLAPVVGLLVK
jgi:hypothetical protein